MIRIEIKEIKVINTTGEIFLTAAEVDRLKKVITDGFVLEEPKEDSEDW